MKISWLPIWLSAFLLVSCQEEKPDQETSPPAGEPEAPSTEAPAGEPKDSDFVGLSVEDAEALAKERGLSHRTVEVDGEGMAATTDFRPDRLNFSIEKGKIIKVTRG